MEKYPVELLWDEIEYLAYHVHWPLEALLDMEHADRIRMVNLVAGLNTRSLDEAKSLLS